MTQVEQEVVEAACAVAKWNEENGQVNRLTGFQNLELLEALVSAVDAYLTRKTPVTQPRITAETHDDEYFYTVSSFDCTPWFEQAEDEEITDLAECGWGGDYPSDVVAEFFNENEDYPDITEMFRYKQTGFECHVSDAEALAWLAVHRPHLVKQCGADTDGKLT